MCRLTDTKGQHMVQHGGGYCVEIPTLSLGHDLSLGRWPPSFTTSVRETQGLKKETSSLNQLLLYRNEIRTSGWVHHKVSACASDLLLVGSLHTHDRWFRQREIVANLREGRDALSLTTFFIDSEHW